MAIPACEGNGKPSGRSLSAIGLSASGTVHWNQSANDLIEMAVVREEGILSAHGALVTETGDRTGRSPNDKFIVDEKSSSEHVNWGTVNVSTSQEVFDGLKAKVINLNCSRQVVAKSAKACGT